MTENVYDETSIKVLEGIEGVRRRPSMYIGDVGSRGLHHLVFEVVDNSVDEAMANRCSEAEIIIYEDNSISVRDDGAGIPSDIHPEYKISTLEVILTKLHSGGKFGKKAYTVSGGLHGVGLSVVSALSEKFEVLVTRDNKVYLQEYSKGKKLWDVKVREQTPEDIHGTMIKFKPDQTIFSITEFSFDILAGRLKELAYLTPGFTITLEDRRVIETGENGEPKFKKVTYRFDGGLRSFIQDTIVNRKKIEVEADIFVVNGSQNGVMVDIALTYTDTFQELLRGYVNNINTTEGGTHISGFKTALTRTINDFARENKLLKDGEDNLRGDDSREGIVAVISVKVPEPQFEGQTKTKLGNSEVDGIVQGVFGKAFKNFLSENVNYGKAIVQKAVLSRRARMAAQKARDLIRKNNSKKVSLPGKLIASREKDPMKRELFLVEGQSAGGTAVEARNAENQEILFLRGKVLNVEKARLSKVLDNQEIRNIITAIGTDIDERFDISNLRYGKIIILTDADVDGLHIATLLLTLFYRHMPGLIEDGYIYVSRPPLFRLTFLGKSSKVYGKPYTYLVSEKDLDTMLTSAKDMDIEMKDVSISRFKGLGEMNAEQLEETVMDVLTRKLERVIVPNFQDAETWITRLMGDDIQGRKKFINQEVFANETENIEGEFFNSVFNKVEEEETLELYNDEIDEIENRELSKDEELVALLEDWAQEPHF